MVIKHMLSGMVAALTVLFAVPALASAHNLAVSVGPSSCVSPLNGDYTATVTITETNFGGTTEDIPVGQNVHELSSSTDHGNTGLNQNYFTQGAVGTQTGPVNLGQPTVFTSPASGGAATQHFTVTTSVPETYVLGNSYMGSPSSATVTLPHGGCTPPPPPSPPTVSVSSASQCTTPLNGTYSDTITVTSSAAFSVPAGTSSGANGINYLTGSATGEPSSFKSGTTTFTLTGLTGQQVYLIGAPGGNVASVTLSPPSAGCTPPPPTCATGQMLSGNTCVNITCPTGQMLSGNTCVNITCPTGQMLSGNTCVTQTTTCPAGEVMSGGKCVTETCPTGQMLSKGSCVNRPFQPLGQAKQHGAACVAADSDYRVRAGQMNTVLVWVHSQSKSVAGAKVRITLPGGKTMLATAGRSGKVSFTFKPKYSGTIYVQTTSCLGSAKVKVFAPKLATSNSLPSYTG